MFFSIQKPGVLSDLLRHSNSTGCKSLSPLRYGGDFCSPVFIGGKYRGNAGQQSVNRRTGTFLTAIF